MSADAYLKVKDINGKSTDDKHKDWIEVLSYSWGVSQSASGGGMQTEGRANLQDLSITKELDIASPKLAEECAKGTRIDEVKMELCRAGGKQEKYMEYTLEKCIVSSYSTGGGGGGTPVETITFNYGKIKWNYIKLDDKGSAAGNVPGGWDCIANKPFK